MTILDAVLLCAVLVGVVWLMRSGRHRCGGDCSSCRNCGHR